MSYRANRDATCAKLEALERELATVEREIALREEVLDALGFARRTDELARRREQALEETIARVRAEAATLRDCTPRAVAASRGLMWVALAALGAAAACRWLCPV